VKTTAPKQYVSPSAAPDQTRFSDDPRYCVRPNSGRIEPGATVDVSGELPNAPICEKITA